MQAYGWSLPAKGITSAATPTAGPTTPPSQRHPPPSFSAPCTPVANESYTPLVKSTSQVPVPVPVYCRPLMEKEPGMKVTYIVLKI